MVRKASNGVAMTLYDQLKVPLLSASVAGLVHHDLQGGQNLIRLRCMVFLDRHTFEEIGIFVRLATTVY